MSRALQAVKLVSVYGPGPNAKQETVDLLYEIVKERLAEPKSNISHQALPSLEEHARFVQRRPFRFWYLIETDNRAFDDDLKSRAIDDDLKVGLVSATYRNEIGIVIRPQYRRNGYARAALQEMMREHDPLPAEASFRGARWLAHIAPKNEASLALFKGLGGRLIQVTLEL